MKGERLVIVDGVRTPFCKMGTDLARLGADELGRIAVNALLTRTGLDPHRIDEVIFGCVGQPADAANVARVIALRAGIPEHVPAITVHRNCASGCEAVTQAYEKMVAGRGSTFVVGGTESMSQYPLLFKQSTAAKLSAFSTAKTFGRKLGALARLKPVFDRKTGTVTAGNASQITDGAVALLVMSESKANELGFAPLGCLTGYAYAGCDPSRMGLGPVFAIHKAETQTGLTLGQADLIEINEAFAAQVLAVLKAMESEKFARKALRRDMPPGAVLREKLNVNGGAIALGHPVGATGARLILTSLKELKRRRAKRALVSLCVGGGQGAALWLEAL